MCQRTRGMWLAIWAIVLCLVACSPDSGKKPSGTAPPAPPMPAHWKVIYDFQVPVEQVKAMIKKHGVDFSNVRNIAYDVNGKRVTLNVTTVPDSENAEKLMTKLRSLKIEEGLLRKGLIVYEFGGKNDSIPDIIEGRKYIEGHKDVDSINAIHEDNELNITYQRLMKHLNNEQKSELKKTQRLWIKYKNTLCNFETQVSSEDYRTSENISNNQVTKCIYRLTHNRVKELRDNLETLYSSSKKLNWKRKSFQFPTDELSCKGEQFVHYDEQYRTNVGVVLCNKDDQIRIYLSSSEDGKYYQATDGSGHGQDHCELVNPKFMISNDDDINSGGCYFCKTDKNLPIEFVDVWNRNSFGESFRFEHSGQWSYQTTRLKCGVSFSDCVTDVNKTVLCKTRIKY